MAFSALWNAWQPKQGGKRFASGPTELEKDGYAVARLNNVRVDNGCVHELTSIGSLASNTNSIMYFLPCKDPSRMRHGATVLYFLDRLPENFH